MADILQRYIDTIPKILRPSYNRVLNALLTAIATSDETIQSQIQIGKDQLFVRTASGRYLDILANSRGVSRPPTLGLSDTDFQELIPNLSLKPKQIKKSFYDTADVFWGPLYSRANTTSVNAAPYDISPGDLLYIKINGGETQEVKVFAADVVTPGSMTAAEVVAMLSRIDGATASVIDELGVERINVRTNTPGSVGSIEILTTSTMISSSKLDLAFGELTILDLDQRVAVYNLTPNELLIEIPAVVPALRRTLLGSHHFHADSTLEPPKGTEQGIWAGSFLFNPNASAGSFTVTSQSAVIQQTIQKGTVQISLTVDDATPFTDSDGYIILNFGLNTQEVPIRYRGIPNSNTLLIDPAYVFQYNHSIGETVRVVSQLEPYAPNRDGSDLAIYLPSPSGSREIVQDILQTLKAAGIVITFLIRAPGYLYIVDNPYLSEDDAPSS